MHSDPNKPKLPPNGFFRYFAEKQADADWVSEATQDADSANKRLPALSKKAGTEWRAMSDSEKQVRARPLSTLCRADVVV